MTAKILFINSTPQQAAGGERHLIALAEACAADGFEAVIGCQAGGGLERALRASNITTRTIDFQAGFFSTIMAVRRLCREERPDILHTTSFWTNSVGRLGGFLARVPVIISTVHCEPDSTMSFKEGFIWRWNQRLRDRLDRFTSIFARRVIAVSESVGRKLVKIGIPETKIAVIPNAISQELTERLAEAEPGIDLPAGKRIACVGRLEPVKGMAFLLDAARLLDGHGYDFQLIIIGDGPLETELKLKTKRAGLDPKVTFTGWLSVADTLGTLARVDMYVLPSLSEGFNTTLLEALLLARPTVATTVGGNPEVVISRETGLLVPPKDADALAEAIAAILEDPSAGEMMGLSGRKLVIEKYTQDRMIASTIELYREMLAGRGEGKGERGKRKA